MLTNNDILRIITAHREVFATKEELMDLRNEMHNDFSVLQLSVDNIAKKVDDYSQEKDVLLYKVKRSESWIHQLADKVGIKLKY